MYQVLRMLFSLNNDTLRLFQKKLLCAGDYFQYIFHIIRQIFYSSVLNLLRNTEAGFGDGADDGSDGIAIAAMRYG